MRISLEQYLNRLAERTVDNTKQLKKGVRQRRNGMTDLYGVQFSAEGDATHPATFYVSVSPDMVYLEQLAFKFVIRPYSATVKGGTSDATVSVNNTSLSVSGSSVSPNPHSHTTGSHSHNVVSGKTLVQTVSDYWRVRVAGIDITAYLMEQQDGDWIDMTGATGERVFPNKGVTDLEDFYDLLGVASMMYAEGNDDDAKALLKPEFKKVEIVSDAPFGVDAYLYTKLSHLNR